MRYRLYNLIIDSDLELALLPKDDGEGGADLVVRQGRVAFDLPNALHEVSWYQVGREAFVVEIQKVARFKVCQGRHVTIERFFGAGDNEVALYLLGSVIAGALLQRDVFLLHACAVAADSGAILIAGEPGAGKSTLTAALVRQGYRLVADDVCLLTIKDGRAMVHPGYPYIKLWSDSLDLLDISAHGLSRVQSGENKFYWPVGAFFGDAPQPVDAFFELASGDGAEVVLSKLSGVDRILTLIRNGYRGEFLQFIGSHKANIVYWTAVAGRFPLFRLFVPRTSGIPGGLFMGVEAIVKHLKEDKMWIMN